MPETVEHKIQLNFGSSDIKRTVIKQYSDRTHDLLITLYNNEDILRIDPDWNIAISVRKPDSSFVVEFGSTDTGDSMIQTDDSTIRVTVTKQMLTTPGTEKCELAIYKRDGSCYFSDTFYIYVEPNINYGSQLESTSEYDSIVDTLNRIKDHEEDAEKTKDHIHDVSDEVHQLKVDIEDTYNELKDAVDTTNGLIEENRKISANESERKESEQQRKEDEKQREENERIRQENTAKAISDAEKATKKAKDAITSHNTDTTAHSDIRTLVSELTARLNTVANSDDVTLDQLKEIVDYIKANRSLIESITTNKVSVSDIIDNLTSTATNKPLSANQGKVLKGLIDTMTASLNDLQDRAGTAEVGIVRRVTADANYSPGGNRFDIKEFSSNSTNTPSSDWYHILTSQGSDPAYEVQLALGMTTKNIMFRRKSSGTWVDWVPLITGSNRDSYIPYGLSDLDMKVVYQGTYTDKTFRSLSANAVLNTDCLLKVIRNNITNDTEIPWLLGNYSAGIAFGGSDTRGVLSMRYDTPVVRFAGGNMTQTTEWWYDLKGKKGKIYDLENFPAGMADYLVDRTNGKKVAMNYGAAGLSGTDWFAAFNPAGDEVRAISPQNAGNAIINGLTEGTDAPKDSDYYVCQYAGGGNTTKTYHRRPMSAMWNWIKGKTSDAFVSKSGDTMSANLKISKSKAEDTYFMAERTDTGVRVNFGVGSGGTNHGVYSAKLAKWLLHADATKVYLNGTEVPSNPKFTDTVYTHPTTAGNKHIPSGGAKGNSLRWSSNGTASWSSSLVTQYLNKSNTTIALKNIISNAGHGIYGVFCEASSYYANQMFILAYGENSTRVSRFVLTENSGSGGCSIDSTCTLSIGGVNSVTFNIFVYRLH